MGSICWILGSIGGDRALWVVIFFYCPYLNFGDRCFFHTPGFIESGNSNAFSFVCVCNGLFLAIIDASAVFERDIGMFVQEACKNLGEIRKHLTRDVRTLISTPIFIFF